MLEWAVEKNLFIQSRGKAPQFGLKAKAGRVFSVRSDWSLYAYFGKIERGKFSSDENRYEPQRRVRQKPVFTSTEIFRL
jgi:hypothetical protein